MGFPLTATRLRFTCEATTPLRLEVENFRAGSNLRGALGQVMQRTYCAGDREEALHAATCPVCWLLAANERPGQERRGYALVPPVGEGDVPTERLYARGDRFEFGITLFGDALKFLPYFVLAVPEMGRIGVGPGHGKFSLKSVWAENPFTRARECLLAEGDNLVHTPTLTITHADVSNEAEHAARSSLEFNGRLTIRFITPTRLIEDGKLVQAPEFKAFFARALNRVDELAEQFADAAPRGMEAAQSLERLAESVTLVDQDTHWVDVFSGSSRRGAASPIGGIVGWATYAASAEVWQTLLPWLLWAQVAQVGKSAVKGNGVMVVQWCDS